MRMHLTGFQSYYFRGRAIYMRAHIALDDNYLLLVDYCLN